MGLEATEHVFGVSDKARFKPVSSATETSKKIEIYLVASLDMILSKNEKQRCLSVCAETQAGLRLCCLQTTKVEAHIITNGVDCLACTILN